MKKLIQYIRECFCKHDWEREEMIVEEWNGPYGASKQNWPKVSATCKKCGYHRSYWKF